MENQAQRTIPQKIVLVVDDDSVLVGKLIEKIDAAGMKGVGVFSGKEALNYVSAHKVDFIILDFIMSEMDGYTFYHILIHDMKLRIPAVVLTIMSKPSPTPEGLEVFSKVEVNLDDLVAKIKSRLLLAA